MRKITQLSTSTLGGAVRFRWAAPVAACALAAACSRMPSGRPGQSQVCSGSAAVPVAPQWSHRSGRRGEVHHRRRQRNTVGAAGALDGAHAIQNSGSRGAGDQAARLFGAAEALREGIGAPIPGTWRPGYEKDVAVARIALGPEHHDAVR